jgi:hypothetical protein
MTLRTLAAVILLTLAGASHQLRADQPAAASAPATSATEYKMLTGYKQPFNDDLQLHLSKGWTPSGGVGVTVWNNDLYFAVLLSRPAQTSR